MATDPHMDPRLAGLDAQQLKAVEAFVGKLRASAADPSSVLNELLDKRNEAVARALSGAGSPATPAEPLTFDAFTAEVPDLDALAQQQGVLPVDTVEELAAPFWPADETADEVISAVRAWRREGVSEQPG